MNPPTMKTTLVAWLTALIVALAGCATPERAPEQPPVDVAPSTWRQVERDIAAASNAATGPARNYAHGLMDSWRSRVRQRTETDFIPWFSGYWTQQWLAIRVAWYQLSSGGGSDPVTRRLASYLQQQYHDRVLEPVSREVDPDDVRRQATTLYVKLLAEQFQAIPRRYAVPRDQFDRRLKEIPAIALSPARNASLYQIIHADPLAALPAWVALHEQMRLAAAGAPAESRVSPVAKRASEKLIARLAASGGASAAAAAVGGVAGVVISLGAAGFGAFAHHSERPQMEALLRENLDAALDDMWRSLIDDSASGVMAGVDHLAGRIEASLAEPLTDASDAGDDECAEPGSCDESDEATAIDEFNELDASDASNERGAAGEGAADQ